MDEAQLADPRFRHRGFHHQADDFLYPALDLDRRDRIQAVQIPGEVDDVARAHGFACSRTRSMQRSCVSMRASITPTSLWMMQPPGLTSGFGSTQISLAPPSRSFNSSNLPRTR